MGILALESRLFSIFIHVMWIEEGREQWVTFCDLRQCFVFLPCFHTVGLATGLIHQLFKTSSKSSVIDDLTQPG